MDRAERTGLGIALVGHVALLALLSLNLAKPPLPKIVSTPVEVELMGEVGLESTMPEPAPEAAPALAPDPGPSTPPAPAPEPAPAPPAPAPVPPRPAPPKPAPPRPAPPKPAAKPAPAKPAAKPAPAKPAAKPAAKPSPKPAPRPADQSARRRPDAPAGRPANAGVRPTGRLDGLFGSQGAKPAAPPASKPAAKAGPEVQSALAAEIRRQIKPHWRAPTGAEVELLRVRIVVRLNRDGSLAGSPEIKDPGVTGVTDSNRSQAAVFAERAIKAVRAAAPFNLPAEYYDAWKIIDSVNFDRRLSQ